MLAPLLALALEVADVPRRPWEPPQASAQFAPKLPEHEKPATLRVVPKHMDRAAYRAAVRKLRKLQRKRNK